MPAHPRAVSSGSPLSPWIQRSPRPRVRSRPTPLNLPSATSSRSSSSAAEVGTTGSVIHWARRYDALVWLLTFGRERGFRERTLDLAMLRPGDAVLDVGCGTGLLAIVAKRRVGAQGAVHGIDASPEMIARARAKTR